MMRPCISLPIPREKNIKNIYLLSHLSCLITEIVRPTTPLPSLIAIEIGVFMHLCNRFRPAWEMRIPKFRDVASSQPFSETTDLNKFWKICFMARILKGPNYFFLCFSPLFPYSIAFYKFFQTPFSTSKERQKYIWDVEFKR